MKRMLCGLLALCLGLGCAGCTWMDGSYVSVTPHQVSASPTGGDAITVSGYADLRTALTGLIDSGTAEGLFTLEDYPLEDAAADMQTAVAYATGTYPIGAYAVESIDYDFGTGMGANAISVDITFRHTSQEIDRIRTVRWMSGAQSAIADALSSCEGSLVLQVTGYQDTDYTQLVADYAAAHPDVVMETPQVTANVYPARGDVRVLELEFTYQNSREDLRQMQEQVRPIFSSAALYVNNDADAYTKYVQLYNFLMERYDYTLGTSFTPAYSLLCGGVGDSKAFAQVYAAMCRQIGLEAVTVPGTCGEEPRIWNIVCIDGIYYHVDLLDCASRGHFTLLGDQEMAGYVWDTAAYPACGQPQPEETVPETTDPAPTE